MDSSVSRNTWRAVHVPDATPIRRPDLFGLPDWRWTLTGTHEGVFAGLAPTGRRAILRGTNFQRVKNGKVVEHWTTVDVFGAMQALR
jgi:hypothetical protein